MSDETDRPTDRPDADGDDADKAAAAERARLVRETPAPEVDQDAPGLSVLGQQSGPPVEPNEPA